MAIKASPEIVEIFLQGEKIAQHTRLFGRNEQALKLTHYLPLLEKRWRAVLDAAPVKQNLSEEAYEDLKASYGNQKRIREILYREAGLPLKDKTDDDSTQSKIIINDPVKVRAVDLQMYDNLASGW